MPAPTNDNIPSRSRVEPGSVNIPLGDYPSTSTSTSESVDAAKVASDVIEKLNGAIAKKEHDALAELFLKYKSYWRDHLALTWELRTVKGQAGIVEFLKGSKTLPTKIEIDSSTPFKAPRFGPIDAWGDVNGIVFFITFETELGRGQGVVTLAEENAKWLVFTLFTVLTELKGFEEPTSKRRTRGVEHGGNPDRKNWRETRDAEANFEGSEPTVLILGMWSHGLKSGNLKY